jgi:hypothetical protein
MRLNQLVALPERVTSISAPAVIGRTLRDVGTHGVELNVPVTGEEISVALAGPSSRDTDLPTA